MKRLHKITALTVLAVLLAGIGGISMSARAQQASAAATATQNDTPVIGRTTPAQHALADLVSARIRAGLHGQPYRVEQSCDGDDCIISIHQ